MSIPPQPTEEIQEPWLSGHLYHHQSLDPVVQGFVHPLAAALAKAGQIDAFFFVRYFLGGPHVRLRLRVVPGEREQVLAAMQQAAESFLELSPSSRSLDEEAIWRTNAAILAADPQETDDGVYPDNSFRVVPFRPEVERYGGAGLFRASLDFFALSSVAAVEFLSRYGSAPRSVQLAGAFRLLLQQALGFAADETELADLLRYGVDSWGESLPKIVEKGDELARSQADDLLKMFHQSLATVRESTPSGGIPSLLVLGSQRLSAVAGAADRSTRAGIGGSQLHMTANRLGLTNAEELYLSRLLTATLGEARRRGEQGLSWREEGMRLGQASEASGMLLPAALALLSGLGAALSS